MQSFVTMAIAYSAQMCSLHSAYTAHCTAYTSGLLPALLQAISQALCKCFTIPFHIPYLFIYQVTSYHKKLQTSSRSISKALKHAIPSKPTHKLAESKRYLVTWWGDSEGPKGHLSLQPPHQVKVKKAKIDL